MGKSKPRNRVKYRGGPTSRPAKSPSDPELALIREQRIIPIITNLQNSDLPTRSSAARAIINIIEDEKCRKLLLREQIVRVLFEQMLTDSSLETRTDGWGILRNLALEEEADFCTHLYRQDVLTAIEEAIRFIVETIEKPSHMQNLPKAQQDLLWNLTSSIINILTTLSESRNEVVEAICNLPSIKNFLFGLLAFEATPVRIKSEILGCLTVLTEDNKLLDQQIVNHGDWFKELIVIKDSSHANAISACGVLHNIFVSMQCFDRNTPIAGVSDGMLLPVLVQYMDQATRPIGDNQQSPDGILQLALEIIASIATSLQEALEHGNQNEKIIKPFRDKFAEGNDVMDTNLDLGDAGELDHYMNGEMSEEEIDADMETITGNVPDEEDSPSEEITLGCLVRIAAPKILGLARPAGHGATDIKSHALSALNNIAWTISTIDFSTNHLASLRKFWVSLSQDIWDEVISPVLASNTDDIELASTITSLAWAVSRSVKGCITIQPQEQRKFMALYQASKGLDNNGSSKHSDKTDDIHSFQGLGVKCIGVLGSLALEPAPVELNREIGIFLLTVLSSLPEELPANIVEALNQLFDIYADKGFSFDEPVFWGDNFYKHLEDILPKAKKMAKSIDKRLLPELRLRLDEAVLNLGRFLVYKKNEKATNRQ